ncbi:Myb-like DNA-binding domain-containing protein [Clostridium sp. HMP27]|uniref:Myb-like DNA-binding domain-containing protein n=1 Tax=Clostridium sp. HMP27 TaxID=1487921 RepID=UPI00068FF809|nr:Myb-like DNA-binding domain-containing protein [Clostridium sp. HMP27]
MGSKNWTAEECSYLEDKWGIISIPTIAATLGRTVNAVKIKAQKIGLGRHLHSGTEITINELANALGKGTSYGWIADRWCRYGLPVKYKKSINKRYKVIDIDQFWKWAEKHKDIIDFSKFESNMLGKEPSWVEEKRKADIAAARYKRTPWTKDEDNTLISMLNAYKYNYSEISECLKRTEGAIKRRMLDLGLKQRPLKADNHVPWTDEEVGILVSLRMRGYSPEVISKKIGGTRSALAVRGKLERMEMI